MKTEPSRPHYAWIVLAMATMVVFGALGLARFGYASLLPAMQQDLHLANVHTGLLATANLVGYLLFSFLGGALASHFGPRAVIAAGLALAGTGMALTGLAHSLASIMLWRAVTGIGSGASNVPVMGLLAAWFAPRRRGAAAGVAVAGSSLGLMFVGPVVPRVLDAAGAAGWRACWFLFGGVALALAGAAAALLRNRPAEEGLPIFGLRPGDPEPESPSGRLRLRLVYGSGAVWALGLVYIAFGFSYIIYMTFFIKHLVSGAGYSAQGAGRLFFIMGVCSLFCGLIWGSLSDRIGRRSALAAVYVVQAASYALFAFCAAPWGLTLSAVLFGLTAWSIPAIMAAACGDVLGPRLAPAGLGFVTLFFGVGQALGPSVAGAMADAFGSLSSAFLLSAAIATAGSVGALLLPTPRHTAA